MKVLIFLIPLLLIAFKTHASTGSLFPELATISPEASMESPEGMSVKDLGKYKILDYAYEILSKSGLGFPRVELLDGLPEKCIPLKAAAYANRDEHPNKVFICNNFFSDIKAISDVVEHRDLKIRNRELSDKGERYKFIARDELIRSYGAASIVHEILHLMGFHHCAAMYEVHDSIYRSAGVPNFFKNPHPSFSDWAVYQFGLSEK